MPSGRYDFLVLGAGIAGCALAYHLTRRGGRSVALYDPHTPAAGATGRAAGIVTEQLWNRWDVEVTRESGREYAALAAQWDPSAYARNGFVRVARGAAAAGAIAAAEARLREWGVEVGPLSVGELTERVPGGVFSDVTATLYSPGDSVVTPSAIAGLYAEGARRGGAEFLLGTPNGKVERGPADFSLTVGGERLQARHAILAAGAWTKSLAQGLGRPLPLTPYRTQAAILRPPHPTEALFPSVHDIDRDVYVRPEAAGRILAGNGTDSTEADPERFSPGGDERFMTHVAEAFAGRFPGWADSELVRAWAGVCTATPDRRPLIGPVPGDPDLFVITGFNGFGVMRAGGAARRLADLLMAGPGDERSREALRPVLPERFPGPVAPFPPRPGFTLDPGDDPRY